MKITEFLINGFGIFSDQHVAGLSPRLNLFLGDNEAGKSTLLGFFRAVFFGFEPGTSRENPYKPVANVPHGGIITVRMDRDSAHYRIQRGPGPARGEVSVTMPDGTVGGEDVAARLLPGVTKDLYRNVFAFSLDELEALKSLESQEVSPRIYSYGAGAGPVSAVDVESRLEKEMSGLFLPRASTKAINVLLSKIEDVADRLRDLGKASSEYDGLRSELADVNRSLEEAQPSLDELKRKIAQLERLDKAWPSWQQLFSADQELDKLPVISGFPEDGVRRLEDSQKRQAELCEKQDSVSRKLKAQQDRFDKLAVDAELVDAKAGIEELVRGLQHFESALRDLPVQKAEAKQAGEDVGESLRRIGDDWDEDRARGFDTSLPVREEVRQWGDQLKASREASSRATVRNEEAERDHKEKSEGLARAIEEARDAPPSALDSKTLASRENCLRTARTAFAEVERLRQDGKHLDLRRADLNERGRALEQDSESAFRVPVRLGAVVVALLLAGLSVLAWSTPLVAAALVTIAFLIAGGGMLLDRRLRTDERRRRESAAEGLSKVNAALESVAQDLDRNTRDSEAAVKSLDEACAELGHSILSAHDIDAAESDLVIAREALSRRLALEENVKRQQALVDAAERRLREADEAEGTARDAAGKAGGAWVEWLEGKGLRTGMSPEITLEMLGAIETACDKSKAAEKAATREAQIKVHLDDYEGKADELLQQCGREAPDRAALSASVAQLESDLKTSLSNASTRREIEMSLGDLRGELESLDKAIRQERDELETLLSAGEAEDEEQFRRRASIYAKRTELLDRIDGHRGEIDLVAGRGKGAALEAELAETDQVSIQSALRDANDTLDDLDAAMAEQREKRGKLTERVESIEKSEDLSAALLEQASLRAQLETDFSEWCVRAICKELLGQTRERYERERQPRVVQVASGFLHKITDGRYSQILAPLGQQQVELESPGGARLEIAKLSRGTREPLYLSLRFGLVREYAAGAEPLPVIMDDILVNFDPRRCRAAADAILELARSNQVLFFTCHPEVADKLIGLDSGIARFEVQEGHIARA